MTTQVVVEKLENNSKHQTRKRSNNLFNNAETMINNVGCGFVVVSDNKQTKGNNSKQQYLTRKGLQNTCYCCVVVVFV